MPDGLVLALDQGTTGTTVVAVGEDGVPFYVAAPVSTVDLETPDGSAIVIEERPAAEVTTFAPAGTPAWNPAFDVTPARLIASIITELGVLQPSNLSALRPAVTR